MEEGPKVTRTPLLSQAPESFLKLGSTAAPLGSVSQLSAAPSFWGHRLCGRDKGALQCCPVRRPRGQGTL